MTQVEFRTQNQSLIELNKSIININTKIQTNENFYELKFSFRNFCMNKLQLNPEYYFSFLI